MSVMSPESIARKKRATPVIPVVEFTAAAHEHTELGGVDVTVTPGAAAQPLGPYDVPAYGFLRHVVVLVEAAAGSGNTLSADGPWNFFAEVALLDVNGAPIYGPVSGYDLFLTNLYGGFSFLSDPRNAPDYSASPNTFRFCLRIPVEVNHNNGFGALANQNAAAPYKLRFTVNPSTIIWTATTTIPTVRIRTFIETWSMPTPTDLAGRPQAQVPPRHGTTQYWSKQTVAVAAGQGQYKLSRVGNLIRTLLLVGRTAGGARSAAILPTDITVRWDARELLSNEPTVLRRWLANERQYHADVTTTGVPDVPVGAIAYNFDHDMLGHAGDGTAELYLPTIQSSRIEIVGNFQGAGIIDIITNDIAPVEVDQSQRYMEYTDTGFTPEVGAPVRAG